MAKILIVDDSQTDIQFIKSVLVQTGNALSVAMDGEEAEKMLRSEPFDLVILDVVLPKKNGFQLCRELKSDEKLKTIPVLLFTSKKEPTDKAWGEKQGADGYLTKPCEPIDVLTAVKKLLKK